MLRICSYDGELEINQERGVVYFHSSNTGVTALRICSLPTPIPDPRWHITNGAVRKQGDCLDITHMYGTNWEAKCQTSKKS